MNSIPAYTLACGALCAAGLIFLTPAHETTGGTRTSEPGSVEGRSDAPPKRGIVAPRSRTAFVPNQGQWEHEAALVAQFGAATALLEDRGFVVRVPGGDTDGQRTPGAAVRLAFCGAASRSPRGEERLGGIHNYFLGSDSTRWRTGVPRYGKARWSAPWPGIDVVAYEKDRHLEYDVELASGADLARFEVRVEGAQGLSIAADGTLVIATAAGPLHQSTPQSWTVGGDGSRTPIDVRYERRGSDRFGLRSPDWDGAQALVVDPGLVWATYVGGSGQDRINDSHLDGTGVITVVGDTWSANFPTTTGSYQPSFGGDNDGFVARFDPTRSGTGQLLSATYLGGSQRDWANSVSVDSVITVVGSSDSSNFPVSNDAYDSSHNGGIDAVVSVFDLGLSTLLYSTYVGGSTFDRGSRVVVDPATGILTIAGETESTNFPVTAATAYDTSHNGRRDAYLTQLDRSQAPASQLVYSTYFGGTNQDNLNRLILDGSGRIWFCGATSSRTGFSTTPGALYRTHLGGDRDGFVTCIDPNPPPSEPKLYYSTFVSTNRPDFLLAMHLDASGVVTVGGFQVGTNFPTSANAFQRTPPGCSGCDNAFLLQFDPNPAGSSRLLYSTYFTGASSASTHVRDLTVDSAGIITLVGEIGGSSIPATFGAYATSVSGPRDGFVARLDPSRLPSQQLLYATHFGGSGTEFPRGGLAGLTGDVATIAGHTSSTDLQTTPGTYSGTYQGGNDDGFIIQIELLPALQKIGIGCSGSGAGPLRIAVTGNARVPSGTYGVLLSGGPSGPAVFALSGGLLATPLDIGRGCSIFIDQPFLLVPPNAPNRLLLTSIPNVAALVGQRVVLQGAVTDDVTGALVTSEAIEAVLVW